MLLEIITSFFLDMFQAEKMIKRELWEWAAKFPFFK